MKKDAAAVLGAVRARAGVGHREHAGARVAELEVLVGELLAVDGLAARACACARDRPGLGVRGSTSAPSSSNNSDGTRTRNPQIRSLIRYPLRHGVVFVCVEEQGFEPWAFRMQSGRSATELHPQICIGRGRGTVAAREVAALAHEVRDDAVEGGALEVERLARAARACAGIVPSDTASVTDTRFERVTFRTGI